MSTALRFDGQTVVIVGANAVASEALIDFFGIRGANLAILEISPATAETATVSYRHEVLVVRDNPQNRDAVLSPVLSRFGTVHVLVDVSSITLQGGNSTFAEEDDLEWRSMIDVQQKTRFKILKATWPVFRKQGYGRIIHLVPATMLHGESVITTTSVMSLRGMVQTLAKEGMKYNMITNMIATDELKYVLPLLEQLAHDSNSGETGAVFEATKHCGVNQIRWERSQGSSFNPDLPSFTPEAILHQWKYICDFSAATYPNGPNDMMSLLEQNKKLPIAEGGRQLISFGGRVVVVTGAGGNLGASYARLFAKLGASVVVNDPNKANADAVVAAINNSGGKSVSNYDSVVDSASTIIDTAIRNYGRIDVLVNNAGFLRDQTFLKMTEEKWDTVLAVHLQGTYEMSKAAWPYFRHQRYGRIINTSSTSGIYGFFGQVNYAAAKLGIFGLTQAMSRSGAAHNIYAHAIAPVAGSQAAMDMGWNLPPSLKASYNAPLVALLGSDRAPASNADYIFEQGAGWIGATRQKGFPVLSTGLGRIHGLFDSAEKFKRNISAAKALKSKPVTYTYTTKDLLLYNLSVGARREDISLVYENHPNFTIVPTFGVIPGFHSIPYFGNHAPYGLDYLIPNFNPSNLLHMEQYLEIVAPLSFPSPSSQLPSPNPIPTAGATLLTDIKLLDVVNKGKNAILMFEQHTRDSKTNGLVYYNEMSIFVRNAAGIGTSPSLSPSLSPVVAAASTRRSVANAPPVPIHMLLNKKKTERPDLVISERIPSEAAALYRLNADMHPIHIDPSAAQAAGFDSGKPILHGLCTLGFVGRLIQERFCSDDNAGARLALRKVRVRFVSVFVPGQTLEIKFWSLGPSEHGNEKVFMAFEVKVVETGKVCVGDAWAELALMFNSAEAESNESASVAKL